MQRLGIGSEEDDAMQRYELSFERPLTQLQIEALTALAVAPGVKATVLRGPRNAAIAAGERVVS